MVSFDIQNVIDDHFMQTLREELEEIGKIRFTKYINEMIWVAFMDHGKALEATTKGQIKVNADIRKACSLILRMVLDIFL